MYSARLLSEMHSRFWISFGRYMAPVHAASGGVISWLNYKTGIKDIAFRMHVTTSEAYVGIEMAHKDPEMRQKYFRHFHVLKESFESECGDQWQWEEEALNINGKPVSRIYVRMEQVNICDESTWPAIISFLKPCIIALDGFWFRNREFFEWLP